MFFCHPLGRIIFLDNQKVFGLGPACAGLSASAGKQHLKTETSKPFFGLAVGTAGRKKITGYCYNLFFRLELFLLGG